MTFDGYEVYTEIVKMIIFVLYFVTVGVCTYGEGTKPVVKGHQTSFFGGGSILSLVVIRGPESSH